MEDNTIKLIEALTPIGGVIVALAGLGLTFHFNKRDEVSVVIVIGTPSGLI